MIRGFYPSQMLSDDGRHAAAESVIAPHPHHPLEPLSPHCILLQIDNISTLVASAISSTPFAIIYCRLLRKCSRRWKRRITATRTKMCSGSPALSITTISASICFSHLTNKHVQIMILWGKTGTLPFSAHA